MSGKAYFVATPIGNLGDMSFRAVEVLKSVDIIFCEDTRHSQVLLDHFDIKKSTMAHHKYNELNSTNGIIPLLQEGKNIAIISDAGTPCISDPGNILINALIENNIDYTVIPGACAFVNAFVLSGLKPPFVFLGFLPDKNVDKQTIMEDIASNSVLIFYSAVHNINDDLTFLHDKLGQRNVVVVKEITKMYETIYRGKLGELVINDPKGEFVIIVDRIDATNVLNLLTIDKHIEFYVNNGLSKMDAIKAVAKDLGLSKNEIYKQTL